MNRMTRTRYDYPTTLAASNVAELLKLDGHTVELDGNWITTNAPHSVVEKVHAELLALLVSSIPRREP